MAPIFLRPVFYLAVFGVDFYQKFIGFYVGGDGTRRPCGICSLDGVSNVIIMPVPVLYRTG